MILHGYYRSSASFRVRIALNLKQLSYENRFHHLRRQEQRAPEYLALNPLGLVPSLEVDGLTLTQSMSIIEYLDETVPQPPLLPGTARDRAYVRSLAQIISCDIHPIDNLRILNYLRGPLQQNEESVALWFNHWIRTGFEAVETLLSASAVKGGYCFGTAPGLADICLVPQVVNAGNFGLDMTPYPAINGIFKTCMALPAFAQAHPKAQPDAE